MTSTELKAYLESKGVGFRILEYREHTMTVEAAEKRLGVSREKIIKSMLFIDEAGRPILAIVSGDKRVSERKLASACGALKVRKAPPEVVKETTGYEVGALSPLGHKKHIQTFIDRGVMAHDKVYGGGGSTNALLEIAPKHIKECTNAIIEDIGE